MGLEGFHREKFGNAVGSLTSLGTIRERVYHALLAIQTVNPSELIDKELGRKLAAVLDEVSAHDEEIEGEGRWQASLRKLGEEDVARISHAILDIHIAFFAKRSPKKVTASYHKGIPPAKSEGWSSRPPEPPVEVRRCWGLRRDRPVA